MLEFSFNGKTNTDLGLRVEDLGTRKRGEQRQESYPVYGRSGLVTENLDEYESYTRQIAVDIKDYSRLNEGFAWLKGSGELRTSKDPGGYFKATVKGLIDPARTGRRNRMVIQFEIEPFFYLDSGAEVQAFTTSPFTMTNSGTYKAEPLVVVHGTGDVTLTVNSIPFRINPLDAYVTIDNDTKRVYKDLLPKGNILLSNGVFIALPPGLNNFSFSAGITKVEIIPRWREL
jgi:phage-related protein